MWERSGRLCISTIGSWLVRSSNNTTPAQLPQIEGDGDVESNSLVACGALTAGGGVVYVGDTGIVLDVSNVSQVGTVHNITWDLGGDSVIQIVGDPDSNEFIATVPGGGSLILGSSALRINGEQVLTAQDTTQNASTKDREWRDTGGTLEMRERTLTFFKGRLTGVGSWSSWNPPQSI